LDEFFLGHFFIDAQVPEKAITTLTRGFPAFVGFVLHMDAHYNFRILRACLRPLVLNNLQLFGLCEHLLHKYPRFRKFSPFVSRSAANQNMIAE
jgi:hypothetical protein